MRHILRLSVFVLLTFFSASLCFADFAEKWSSAGGALVFYDAGNTDADPALELLYGAKAAMDENGSVGFGITLFLVDGATGEYEIMDLTPGYYTGFSKTSNGGLTYQGGPQLTDVDGDGNEEILVWQSTVGLRCFELGVLAAPEPTETSNPLQQSFPNPFGSTTTIQFSLEKDGPAVIHVFDAAGGLVRTLDEGWQPTGAHAMTWDGRDDRGQRLAAGVYFYALGDPSTNGARRMVLIK